VDPSRKRTIRFVVALSAAVLLAGALAYTSFSASTEARQPSELASAVPTPGKKYQLVGKVQRPRSQRQGLGSRDL
jgi:cytochrome c-type biogenesis protein CcmE